MRNQGIGLQPSTEIQATNRRYVVDSNGSLRVLDYNASPVENSEIHKPHPTVIQWMKEKRKMAERAEEVK